MIPIPREGGGGTGLVETLGVMAKKKDSLPSLPSLPSKQFKLLRSSRPVLAQQSRQSAIGKQLTPGLAVRTVVGFVGRVTDALDLFLAARTRFLVSPMHRHFRTKRCDFLGKLVAGQLPQAIGPSAKVVAHRRKKTLDLFRLESLSESEWRKARFEKNLVRVSVADPAKQSRIGERAFQRVVRGGENRSKALQIRFQNFNSARVERGEPFFSGHNMKGRALLRACFGPQQSSIGEIEGSQTARRRKLGITFFQVQAPGNHQVQHQPNVVVEADTNSLTKSAQTDDGLALRVPHRRSGSPQQKWTSDAHTIQALAENTL